jgi:hypothetical protein
MVSRVKTVNECEFDVESRPKSVDVENVQVWRQVRSSREKMRRIARSKETRVNFLVRPRGKAQGKWYLHGPRRDSLTDPMMNRTKGRRAGKRVSVSCMRVSVCDRKGASVACSVEACALMKIESSKDETRFF